MMIGLNRFSDHVIGDTIVRHNGGTGYRTFIGLAPSRHGCRRHDQQRRRRRG